jgi:MoxR-like ATPase
MRFEGSSTYIATPDLKLAVNAALTLTRPLLVKGEPGTGKTLLAEEIARALGRPLHQWHVKSTTKAQQGLYEYDAVSRLRDSQLGDGRVGDIANYIKPGVLWDAFASETPAVVLIDEIDKADIEFPNDLLRELDRMEFHVYETQQTIVARHRPLVVITSNNEKELPDAFLRRCVFHWIAFPERAGHLGRENRLAGSRLSFDEQRTLQRYRRVDRDFEIVGRDVGRGAVELAVLRGVCGFHEHDPSGAAARGAMGLKRTSHHHLVR